jgi:hypothetical protein
LSKAPGWTFEYPTPIIREVTLVTLRAAVFSLTKIVGVATTGDVKIACRTSRASASRE